MFYCFHNRLFMTSRPLDEAKKVKDKFDDIFNTTRYVKCQDEIRKQVTEVKASKFCVTVTAHCEQHL